MMKALVAGSLCWAVLVQAPSGPRIEAYAPSDFEVAIDGGFFYGIELEERSDQGGRLEELRFGPLIDVDEPVLLREDIRDVIVAPDRSHAAVVADGVLWIIRGDGSLKQRVCDVASAYGDRRRTRDHRFTIGERFTRDDSIQWSRDSASLYLIQDTPAYEDWHSVASAQGELWMYRLASNSWVLVRKPFPGFDFFFGPGRESEDLYYVTFDGSRSYALMHVDGQDVAVVSVPEGGEALGLSPFGNLQRSNFSNSPFYPPTHVMEMVRGERSTELLLRGERLLNVHASTWKTIKGNHVDGVNAYRSGFMPGERFFLLNIDCDDFEGELLIDTQTGEYKPVAEGARVYPLFHTLTHPDVRVAVNGLRAR